LQLFQQTVLEFTGRTWKQEVGTGGSRPCIQTMCKDASMDSCPLPCAKAFQDALSAQAADGEYRWVIESGNSEICGENSPLYRVQH